MVFWMWGLVLWATLASLVVVWLAAELTELRSRQLGELAGEALELSWLPDDVGDRSPRTRWDAGSVAAAARAVATRAGATIVQLRPRGH